MELWESVILFLLYIVYVIFMAYNQVVHKWILGITGWPDDSESDDQQLIEMDIITPEVEPEKEKTSLEDVRVDISEVNSVKDGRNTNKGDRNRTTNSALVLGCDVETPYGIGKLTAVRKEDKIAVVELLYGCGYIHLSAVKPTESHRRWTRVKRRATVTITLMGERQKAIRNDQRKPCFIIPSTFRTGILQLAISKKSVAEQAGIHCVSLIKGNVRETFDEIAGESGKISKSEVNISLLSSPFPSRLFSSTQLESFAPPPFSQPTLSPLALLLAIP